MMDILSYQLINRFDGMKSVLTSLQVLEPRFLSNAFQQDIEVEARKFSSLLFSIEMLSVKTSFKEKIAHSKSAEEIASFLVVENASLATTYPDFVRHT